MPALRLILLRHAKSDWGDPALPDHDRPLNERGQRSCDAIGAWLAQNGYVPDQVICSTARRTRETWAGIAQYLPGAKIDFDRALYLAEPQVLQACLEKATGDCVMLIAHNPGIGDFAGEMALAAPAHPKFAQYPTAATLVLDFEARDWGSVAASSGRVADFIVPRDLTG